MKISIITPNYNYEKYISETIESVINQNIHDLEYIIIDDGSTDNSVDKIKEYQIKYPNIIKLIIQENKGQTPAINAGLKIATGDIIGWINSDDTYCDGILSKILTIFEEQNDVDIIIGNANVIDLNGNFIFKIRHTKYDFLSGALLGFTRITTSNAVIWRRSIMEKIGYMNEDLKCNMDGEYFSRLFRYAKVFQISDSIANFRKQKVSKAAEKIQNWNETVVESENYYQRLNSLRFLIKTRYISRKKIIFLKYYLKTKRIFQKFFKLIYIKIYFEKLMYKIKINATIYNKL